MNSSSRFIVPNWPGPSNVKAYVTTKLSALQCESPVTKQNGAQQLMKELNLPSVPQFINQVHGNNVVNANEANFSLAADAVFSREPNKICAVLTADCLPLLICNRQGNEVAAAHAGWRGLAAGVIENTLAQFSTKREGLLVWLGPCIGPLKFEVGEDVYQTFVSKQPEHEHAFQKINQEKWLANLYQLAINVLKKEKIISIFYQNYCTYSQAELFCSYRRENKTTERLVSLIYFV